MFTNIGKKIKIVAAVMFYVLVAVSVIGGFFLIFNFGSLLGTGNAILLGILIMLLGCLIAWISSFMLYGYGELVDNSTIIKDMLMSGAHSERPEQKASPFSGLAKAISSVRAPRQPQPQPVPVQQTQPQTTYQPPQTAPAYGQTRQSAAYTQQPNPYQRAGSTPPSQQQPASLTGRSGWLQLDAQNVQCPNCHYSLPAEQARRYGCCPQCRMPFKP